MIPTKLTILELYEAVWKAPLKSLAEQWHLHPYALGKLLDKHNIPRPPNGYWTKKAVGKEITVPILPQALQRSHLIDLSELQRNIRDTERRKASSLPTPKKPLDFYPLLKGIKTSLSKPGYQYDFILNQTYDDNRVLRLDVSLEQIDRSIGILHLVLSAFDEHGWKVKVGKPKYEKRLMNTVTVDNVDIQFRLRERLIQKKRELSSKEKLDKASNKWIWKENINVPSGRLQLYIDGPMPKGFKSVFEDKPTQSLEYQLGIFVEHLIVCSEHSRRLAEERRICDLEWQAEQARHAEFERAVKVEQQRIESLLGMVAKWQRADQCRTFISEVLSCSQFAEFDAANLQKWQTWSESVADAFDPLKSVELRDQVADIESIREVIFFRAISKLF